jgi:hypothetical protein
MHSHACFDKVWPTDRHGAAAATTQVKRKPEMSQNLIQLTLTPEDYTAIDAALATLETRLAGLIDLSTDERRGLVRMGEKSEAFCRQTLLAMDENRNFVPASVGLDDARADLEQLDALRRRTLRLQRLTGRCEDTTTALGSDVMSAALEGYSLLKMLGKGSGLAPLRETIAGRFSRRGRGAPADTSGAGAEPTGAKVSTSSASSAA